ncbi:MAG: response regulator [Opitutales bacterium]
MRFLHLEDSTPDATSTTALLRREWPGCVVHRVATREQFMTALQAGDFDLILSDYELAQLNGLDALELARVWCPEKPFVFLSGTGGEDHAVEALQRGATDYVIKDRTARLVPAIRQSLSRMEEARRHELTEEALRQNRERFRQIAENVADLIVLVDPEGRRLYGNPAYNEAVGSVGGGTGGVFFGAIAPEDQAHVRQIVADIVRTGLSRRDEFRILRPDGAVRHVEAQGSAIRDSTGQVRNVLIVARDVTERRKSEARIREQAALLDKAQDAIVVQDLSGAITFWNKGAEAVYGWTAAEALGQEAAGLLAVEPVRQRFAREHTLAQGEWRGELRHRTQRRGEVMVQSRWTLVRQERQEDRASRVLLMINTDITDTKLLEAKLLRAQRMESMGMLVGGIAHDLNNVLAPILMSVDLLRTMQPSPPALSLIEAMDRSAKHGASLLKQLLAFARGAEGRHVELDLPPVLTELGEFLTQTLKGNTRVEVLFRRPPPKIQADATQLKQVFLNLCINARDAMPDGGVITIAVDHATLGETEARRLPEGRAGTFVIVSVTDSGTGIPAHLLERIFDPFFTTKESGRGTGLGLPTVQGIVKGHGGFLAVESTVGRGTTFRIYLPVNAAAGPPEAESAPGGTPAILLVDDEEMVRSTLSLLLKVEGYRVYGAEDGNEALKVFRQRREEIALILTDLKMGGMGGVELIAAVRAEAPDLPIIALTAVGASEDAAMLRQAGVQLLPKPLTRPILLKAVEEALATVA